MKSFGIGFVIAILALIILLANSLYIVTDKQTAILLRFGEIIDPKIESGLHFKIPILNTVRKFDSRVLTLDAIPQPYFTEDLVNYTDGIPETYYLDMSYQDKPDDQDTDSHIFKASEAWAFYSPKEESFFIKKAFFLFL